MKAIVLDAILTSFTTRADRSLSFRGSTPELDSKEKVALIDLQGLNVRLLIEPKDYATDGKVEVKGLMDQKSPSERLRGVLFVFWKQQSMAKTIDQPWLEFYINSMERFINDIKSQLEPE